MAGEPGSSVAFEQARLQLARLTLAASDSRIMAIRHATEICARALKVERVGLWSLTTDGSRIECEALYKLSQRRHVHCEAVLYERDFPAYFAAMRSKKAIVAHDAQTDEATRELADAYLRPHGITSMLDAPIFLGGEVVGVVCHEHVGERREWAQTEIDFASSVADIASIVHEQARRLDLEAQLYAAATQHAERSRLEVLGRLARGVAHDFHNVLQPVRLSIELELMGGQVSEETWRELLEALDVGERLVRQLTGRRPVEDEERTCVVDRVATCLAPVLQRLVREQAILVLDLNAPAAAAALTPTQLEQVLLNLVLNAGDAIEQCGRAEPGLITARTRRRGDSVVIEVIDDGIGMSEVTRAHALDLYVTTKPYGSGVGLATVNMLATEAGGSVELESTPGRGTTVRLKLPVV